METQKTNLIKSDQNEDVLIEVLQFNNPISSNSSRKLIAKKLNQKAISHVQSQMLNSKLKVQKESIYQPHIPTTPVHHQNTNISQIIKQRKDLMEEMKRLKFKESELKERKKNLNKNERSHMTKEDQRSIHQVIESIKDFEQENNMKLKRLEEQIKVKKQAEKQELHNKMMQNCKERQQEIVKHLELLKMTQIQREKHIKELNRNYQSVKNKRFLHEIIEQRWQSNQKKQKNIEKQFLQNKKKQKSFSIDKILEHQKNYKTLTNRNYLSRIQKLKEDSAVKKQMQKQIQTHYRPSRFLQTIFEEEQRKLAEERHKEQEFKTLLNNKIKYGQRLREINKQGNSNHSNRKARDSSSLNSRSTDKRSTKVLSLMDLAKLGNNYMRQVHSSIGHVQINKQSVKINLESKDAFKYQDYLKEAKLKRNKQESSPDTRQLRELKSILKKQKPVQDKLYFAKLIAQRLQNKIGNDSKLLIQSINAKISIINQFTKN